MSRSAERQPCRPNRNSEFVSPRWAEPAFRTVAAVEMKSIGPFVYGVVYRGEIFGHKPVSDGQGRKWRGPLKTLTGITIGQGGKGEQKTPVSD